MKCLPMRQNANTTQLPIAKAIVAAAGETDISDCSDFSEVAGGGTSVTVPEGKLLCGGVRLMKNNGVDVSDMPKSPVYVALGGKAVGAVKLAVVSYAAHEPHLDLLVVEVAVETDDIYFQG